MAKELYLKKIEIKVMGFWRKKKGNKIGFIKVDTLKRCWN